MANITVCPNCGEDFERIRSSKKYCSNTCRSAQFMRTKRASTKAYKEKEEVLRKNHQILEKLSEYDRNISISELEFLGFDVNHYTSSYIKDGRSFFVIHDMTISYDKGNNVTISPIGEDAMEKSQPMNYVDIMEKNEQLIKEEKEDLERKHLYEIIEKDRLIRYLIMGLKVLSFLFCASLIYYFFFRSKRDAPNGDPLMIAGGNTSYQLGYDNSTQYLGWYM